MITVQRVDGTVYWIPREWWARYNIDDWDFLPTNTITKSIKQELINWELQPRLGLTVPRQHHPARHLQPIQITYNLWLIECIILISTISRNESLKYLCSLFVGNSLFLSNFDNVNKVRHLPKNTKMDSNKQCFTYNPLLDYIAAKYLFSNDSSDRLSSSTVWKIDDSLNEYHLHVPVGIRIYTS